MTPFISRLIVVAAFGSLSIAIGSAMAAESELREFIIEIEGKPAGKYLMTITRQDDGTLSMRGQADISYKRLIGTYTYTLEGVEHWKDGRLIQLTSKCNDDGTKADVLATADREWLKLKVNGQDRNCRWDVWTTSYWLLPDPKFHNQAVPLLDADSGKEYVGQLKNIGTEKVDIGGQLQNCHLFRVTGGPQSPINLWYDGQHRLVRLDYVEQGKRIVFVLKSVRR